MPFVVDGKYRLEVTINNRVLSETSNIIDEVAIHESINQSLPTVDLKFVNLDNLLEDNPLTDGSQVDIDLTILQNGQEEELLRLETVLWSYESTDITEGTRIKLHCVLSAPDFFEGRIESINGSSFEVFNLVAERSGMQLISDSSIDKQVWIRPGIRGNVWLNDVINHSWASPKSAFVYAVTRERELLRYNLDERASRNPIWFFKPEREFFGEVYGDNVIKFKYPQFSSQSGLLNTFFGYGRDLSTFNVDSGETTSHKPTSFVKRTNFMNLNNNRETPQRRDSLGFDNALNVHENYFNAYAQNMRIKSFYSINVDFLSLYFQNVKLLDRVSLQLNDESRQEKQQTYAGEYFVQGISTILDTTNIVRRFSLTREGLNAPETVSNNSK